MMKGDKIMFFDFFGNADKNGDGRVDMWEAAEELYAYDSIMGTNISGFCPENDVKDSDCYDEDEEEYDDDFEDEDEDDEDEFDDEFDDESDDDCCDEW